MGGNDLLISLSDRKQRNIFHKMSNYIPLKVQNGLSIDNERVVAYADTYHNSFPIFPQRSEIGWNSILTVTAATAVLLMMTSLLRALVRC